MGSVLESVDVKLSPASSAGKEVSGLRLGARRVSRRGRWPRKACGPPKLYISLEGPSSPCSNSEIAWLVCLLSLPTSSHFLCLPHRTVASTLSPSYPYEKPRLSVDWVHKQHIPVHLSMELMGRLSSRSADLLGALIPGTLLLTWPATSCIRCVPKPRQLSLHAPQLPCRGCLFSTQLLCHGVL